MQTEKLKNMDLYQEIVLEVNIVSNKTWEEEHVIFWQYGKNDLYRGDGDEVYYLPNLNITVIMNIESDKEVI